MIEKEDFIMINKGNLRYEYNVIEGICEEIIENKKEYKNILL